MNGRITFIGVEISILYEIEIFNYILEKFPMLNCLLLNITPKMLINVNTIGKLTFFKLIVFPIHP